MVAFILPANSATGGYEISNSLRFRAPDNPLLTRTHSDTNHRTFTFSCWVKRSGLGTGNQRLFSTDDEASDDFRIRFTSADILHVSDSQSGTSYEFDTDRKFRDPSAWYHIVVAWDTTQGTNTNRVKIYVNGVQETSFSTASYPTQNFDTLVNQNTSHEVGGSLYDADGTGPRQPFDGYMSEVYFIDGTAYAASNFGETDDNGVWIPKDAKGDLTFGTNGFYMEFQQTGTSANSSGMGADTSGNDNHFTVTNIDARDVCVDTPTNNFCTFNPLDNAVLALSEGNMKATHSTSSGGEENRGTMGFANGKWYWEFKIGYDVPGNQLQPYGIGLLTNTGRNPLESDLKVTEALAVFWYTDSSNNEVQERIFNTRTTVNASESFADNGDIVQFAVDADAGKVWVGKNNTYLDDASGNVGDPANGNNPIHTYTVVEGNFIFPAIVNVGSQGLTILLNTGNPSFAISSGNADANGYGNFEHAPPSGFYSICSKNLAEFG